MPVDKKGTPSLLGLRHINLRNVAGDTCPVAFTPARPAPIGPICDWPEPDPKRSFESYLELGEGRAKTLLEAFTEGRWRASI